MHRVTLILLYYMYILQSQSLYREVDVVLTDCLLTAGYYAGIGLSLLIIVLTLLVALAPALSAIGVCERCHVENRWCVFLVSSRSGPEEWRNCGNTLFIWNGTLRFLYLFKSTIIY